MSQKDESKWAGIDFKSLLTERILLLVGLIAVPLDGFFLGAFDADSREIFQLRLIIPAYSLIVLVLTFTSSFVRKHIRTFTIILLYQWVLFVCYANFAYNFELDMVLVLNLAVILCSVYFRSDVQLVIFFAITELAAATAIYYGNSTLIPPERYLLRLVFAMVVGYAVFSLNRSIARKLQKSEQRFRLLAEKSKDVIALHDVNGMVIYVSPSVKEMLGYDVEDANELNALDIIHPADRERATALYSEQLIRQQKSIQLEYRVIRKNGEVLWVEAIGTPILEQDGKVDRIITSTRDVSKRKESEARNQEFQETLLKINNELDQFAYVVSHDLKAPLRGISNLATFIEEDLGEAGIPEEVHHNLNLMRSRVNRLEMLIDDILTYSRAGRVSPEPELIEMEQLVRRIVDDLDLPAGFRVEIAEGLPRIRGVRVQFEQVFANLIQNARVHHDKTEGLIRIEYERLEGLHRFSVSDDGPGIAEKYHEKIFEVFQQLQSRDNLEGTGIGLAIVRKVVQNAGGEVWVESKPGKGATFRFTWPADESRFVRANERSEPAKIEENASQG